MDVETERWLATEAIFHDALLAQEPQRTALLDARCQGDTTLMAELRSLLAACEAEEAHRQGVAAEGVQAGTTVGPYVIERLIGRGGMGGVYLAHRGDGQFAQQVAVKIIDMPLVTEYFRQRFRAERQMLAGLAHPYIARLLDGGVSADGELYLVMEFIDGLSITDFCRQQALNVEARLRIFLKVCEAVQYAHQHLIVHRDLKPDNILVVADATPRLLDFGTAKLLQPAPGDVAADVTQAGMQTFTPRYASPEQVLGQAITVASDTYSLGVLLYVLLTDTAPYEVRDFSTEALLQAVCGVQPGRPSQTACPFGPIGGDLDSIVLKALRKEPAERYRTVEQFCQDVQAYLEQRPVQARRGGFRYRAGKFIRRHRLALLAAALLATTLLAGVAGIVWQARVANQQRRLAEARSADLRELSNSLLSELNDALKEIPGSTGAQQLLITRVLEHLDHMAADAHGDRLAALDLIGAYTRLGNVQGNIYYQNLADTKGAVASFDKAIALARPLVAANPGDREALRALAAALEARGESLGDTGSAQASTEALQEAVALYDRLVALPGVTAPLIFEAAIAYETLGSELGDDAGMADPAAATAAYQRALDMDYLALKMDPGYMAVRRGIPLMHTHLGAAVLDTNPAYALEEFILAERLYEALPEDQRNLLRQVRAHGEYLRKQGQADAELGRYAAARALFAQSAAVLQKLADDDKKNVSALRALERVQESVAECEEYAADPATAEPNADPRKILQAARAALEQEAGTIREVIRQSAEHGQNDLQLAVVEIRLSAVQARLGQPTDPARTVAALALIRAAADKSKATPDDLNRAATAFLTAQPSRLRNPALSVAWAQRAASLTHHRSPAFLLLLAQTYRANRQQAEATAVAREGLNLLQDISPTKRATHLIRNFEFIQPAAAK